MNREEKRGGWRLRGEASLYLRQHAGNPVAWWAWGEEAFEEARRRGVPVFVSVGYATCYWCHVMEREVFENEEIAALMNERLVCVKVDREERGDVDGVYMLATQMLTGGGGWPMNVFVLNGEEEDGDGGRLKAGLPFFAGTYWGAEEKFGRPGFGDVMKGVCEAWTNRKLEVVEQAKKVEEAVREAMRGNQGEGVGMDVVNAAVNGVLRNYDVQWGGWRGGGGNKFPQVVTLEGLVEAMEMIDEKERRGEMWDVVRHTLGMMGSGGIYDLIGGGFHRYSTDEEWILPHFEKMGYDQGLMLRMYARAIELEDEVGMKKEYERVVRGTADYLMDRMRSEGGLFYSAEDAEVDGREGGCYVWNEAQVREAVGRGELAEKAVKVFGVDGGENFVEPHGKKGEELARGNVLYRADLRAGEEWASDAEYAEIIGKMKKVREMRKQVARDEKVIVGWNGLVIGGLAEAGRVLGEERYVKAAKEAADALIERAWDGMRLKRIVREDVGNVGGSEGSGGLLEDYAMLGDGLLRLIRSGREGEYLRVVKEIAHRAIEVFGSESGDVGGGGYYDAEEGGELFVRLRSVGDGAMASGGSAMVNLLIDLYEVTGERGYAERVVKDLRSYGKEMKAFGAGMMGMVCALIRAERLFDRELRIELEKEGEETKETEGKDVVLSGEVVGDGVCVVKMKVREGGHVYGNDCKGDVVRTEVRLRDEDVREGWGIEVGWPESRRKVIAGQEMKVYEGEVLIRVKVQAKEEGSVGCENRNLSGGMGVFVRYQVCDDNSCNAPVEEFVKFES